MKRRLTSPTFDASAQTVLHADFSDVTLEGIQMIINVTDNIIIYNFADPTKGGTLSTDTLTLTYDTTLMDDADELMVLVEDGSATQPVSGTFYQATQPVSEASPASRAVTNAGTFAVQVDGAALTALQLIDNFISGSRGLVTEDNSAAIKTALEIIDNMISGSEAQVDIVAALPAGTNNIGDVDVASLPAAAPDTNHFHATITSADATSATTVKAKTAAKKIHVTSLEISVGSTAMEVQLQSDNGTPQVVMEEQFFAANTGLTWTAADKTLPLFIINTNEDLDVIASAAGDVTVSVAGYIS